MHLRFRSSKGPLFIFCLVVIISLACKSGIPETARAITNFDQGKYLGKWYEIARIDFKYEKDMIHTTAHYSLNDKGKIKVLNRGYDTVKKEWDEAHGKAKMVGQPGEARLKVSFFGPFYSGYNVLAIDKDYQYALVGGESAEYLWILSRTPQLPDDIKNNYLKLAKEYGYDVAQLIWVDHQSIVSVK